MRRDELRIYHEAVQAHEKVYRPNRDAPWVPWAYVDHALKGMRVNGRERLSETLIKILQEGEKYLTHLTEHEQGLQDARAVVGKVVQDLKAQFVVCPACKGEQGEKVKDSGVFVYHWEDCATCAGRGMVPQGLKEWQDENRTYTPPEQQLDTRIDGPPERREAV